MQPLPADDEQALRNNWFRFVALMRETSPERPEAFYHIARVGRVAIGIGSALEPKTLIRIAGPTDSADDDYILEARITSVPDGRECVSPRQRRSLHVFMLMELLGHRLPEVFGFVPREGSADARELWIQSWDSGYREISVADLRDQTDLDELAKDAGTQLAGHFWATFPEHLRLHERYAQLRAFEMTEDRARDLGRDLARETVTEWERFRRQRDGRGPSRNGLSERLMCQGLEPIQHDVDVCRRFLRSHRLHHQNRPVADTSYPAPPVSVRR